MKVPSGDWFMMDEAVSTQDIAATLLEKPDCPSVVFTRHQLEGRGRFKRKWESRRDDSLTYSLILHEHTGHRKPWLIGMAVAIAVAQTLGGKVQWPNDVVMNGKKVAGVLIELLPFDSDLKTPVVGVGVNLNQTEFFYELALRATSVFIETGVRSEPLVVGRAVLEKLSSLPEPEDWTAIEPLWRELDTTPGKRFQLTTGEDATALRVGDDGALVCQVGTEERTVMAAEAILGQ